jgi:prepilin-type N-terminal cleavage/methylation domain-containing protein
MTVAPRRAAFAAARRRGFTLLEAIVALAIIGIALIPVMSFLAQAARQLTAAAESNLQVAAQQAAMAYVEVLNPQKNPVGEAPLSDTLTLRWTSRRLTDPDSGDMLGGRLGGYRLGFFVVEVTVVRDGRDWFTFDARKIGYEPRGAAIGGALP